MQIDYSRTFKKMFKKQPLSIQNKFEERLNLFMENPHSHLLHKHGLSGEWSGCHSINITGDIRAVFEEISDEYFEFIAIGSHSELYK